MTIGPVDRRGLAEVVAFATALLAITVVMLAEIVRGQLDPEIRGLFISAWTILVARGTKAAMDRSGAADAASSSAPRDPPPS